MASGNQQLTIAQLLREEIDPKLEKLRAEKRSYLEYQKATSELERLTRLVKAYEWKLVVDKLDKAAGNINQKKKDIEVAKEDIERGGRECKGMESELADIEARRTTVRQLVNLVITADLSGNGQGRKGPGSHRRSQCS